MILKAVEQQQLALSGLEKSIQDLLLANESTIGACMYGDGAISGAVESSTLSTSHSPLHARPSHDLTEHKVYIYIYIYKERERD